jgi:hypothetical protein
MLAALRRRVYEGLANGNPEARKGLLRTARSPPKDQDSGSDQYQRV